MRIVCASCVSCDVCVVSCQLSVVCLAFCAYWSHVFALCGIYVLHNRSVFLYFCAFWIGWWPIRCAFVCMISLAHCLLWAFSIVATCLWVYYRATVSTMRDHYSHLCSKVSAMRPFSDAGLYENHWFFERRNPVIRRAVRACEPCHISVARECMIAVCEWVYVEMWAKMQCR